MSITKYSVPYCIGENHSNELTNWYSEMAQSPLAFTICEFCYQHVKNGAGQYYCFIPCNPAFIKCGSSKICHNFKRIENKEYKLCIIDSKGELLWFLDKTDNSFTIEISEEREEIEIIIKIFTKSTKYSIDTPFTSIKLSGDCELTIPILATDKTIMPVKITRDYHNKSICDNISIRVKTIDKDQYKMPIREL